MKNTVLRDFAVLTIAFFRRHGLLVLLLLVFLSLAVYRITECCPWIDEFFSISVAQRPLPMIWNPALNPQKFNFNHIPPLYETLLHFFWDTSGGDLITPRLFSVFLGAVSLLTLYALSQLLFGRLTALLAVFLATLNYSVLYFSKMIRCYALLNALGLVSFYLYFKIAKEEQVKKRYWAFFIAVNAMILYTFYFGGFVIFLEGLFAPMFCAGRKLRYLIRSLFVSFILFIPWAGRFLDDMFDESALHYTSRSAWKELWPTISERFIDGIFFDRPLAIFYALVFFALLIYGVARRGRKSQDGRAVLFLAAVVLIPVLTINYFSTSVSEPSRARYFYMFIFPFFILAAVGITRLRRPMGIPVLLLAGFLSVRGFVLHGQSSIEWYWPAPLSFVAQAAKSFPVAPHEKAVIQIEDAMFVPMFVYYFYGPEYFYDASVPYCGHGIRKLMPLKPNYRVAYSVVGIEKYHVFHGFSVAHQVDWLFLIYSNMFVDLWEKPIKEVYMDQIKAHGLKDALTLAYQRTFGDMTIEVYRVRRPDPLVRQEVVAGASMIPLSPEGR